MRSYLVPDSNSIATTWLTQLRSRASRVNRLFLITVAVPTIFATLYFGLIASDVYISESRFVVRSSQKQAPTGLGVLMQTAGFSRSQDDTYTLHDFMRSRDAIAKINEQLNLKEAFGNRDIELFSRFNPLGLDDSFEALHVFYQKHIGIDLDAASSISTLKIKAFKAEDAYRVNEMLLQLGEQLINQLNERARNDLIRFAATEVDGATKKASAASLALSRYRSLNTVFDPERQSALQLQLISKLQDELIATKTQLAQVRIFTPDNPQILALERRVDTIQTEISSEMSKVTGTGPSLTSKAAEYERLALDRAFADKQLAAALTSLEQARNDAQRKQLYLERIVQPNTPDMAMEPRRIRGVFSTFALGLLAWGIFTLLISSIREHHD